MKKKTKRIIIAAVIVAVIAGGAVTYSVTSANAAQAAKYSTTYGTDIAKTGDISLTVSGSGNLASGETTNVNAPAHLDIDKVLVSAGDIVSVGQDIATVNISKMQTYADTLKTQITTDEDSLNTASSSTSAASSQSSSSSGRGSSSGSSSSGTSSSTSKSAITNFNITTPVDGWVKSIKVSSSSSRNNIENAMNKYSYLCVIATAKKELIDASKSGLAEGTGVTVKCQGNTYTGTVVTVNGTLYVRINTISRTIGANADIYDTKGNKLFSGQIQLQSYVPIVSNYGTIDSRKVSENSSVNAGDVLFEAEQYSLTVKNLYSDLQTVQAEYKAVEDLISAGKLTASKAGVINTLTVANGTTYDEGAALLTLGSPDKWIATVSIDEVDINSIKVGQDASMTLDALPGQTFSGKVSRISNVGTASGGVTTYGVDVTVDSNTSFKAGMSATCEITSQSATGVVMVPVTDVKTINSQSYVMVQVTRTDAEKAQIKQLIGKNDYAGLAQYMGADAQTLGITRLTDLTQLLYGEVRAVQTGIQNASYIEIKNGLSDGEKILAQTTTSSSSNNNRNFMMGGMGGLTGGGGYPNGGSGSNRNSGSSSSRSRS